MKFYQMKFLSLKSVAIFAVVLFAALSSFAAKPAVLSDLTDFDSFSGNLTMRYLEAANNEAFQYLTKQISANDSSINADRVRRYHIGVQRSSNTLIVYKRKSQTIMATVAVAQQTVAQLETISKMSRKSSTAQTGDDEEEISTTTPFTDLISKDLSAYVDSQSAIPEYLPADSRKRGFGLERKVEGGSVSFEASQTIYMKSTDALSSMGQKASLIFKQSVNPHTDAKFEVTHMTGGFGGEDTAAMATISIHGD